MSRFLLIWLIFSVELSAQSIDFSTQLTNIKKQDDNNVVVEKISQLLTQQDITAVQKVDALIIQSKSYLSLNNFDQAMNASEQANNITEKNNLFAQKAEVNKLQGIISYFQGQYKEALAFYRSALKYHQNNNIQQSVVEFRRSSVKQANLLNNIALVQTAQGNSLNALKSYEQAEPLYQKYGDEADKIDVRYNIATLYISLRRIEMAITMLIEVIDKRTTLDDAYGVAAASADLGVAYKYAGLFEQAEKFNLSALSYFQQHEHQYDVAAQLHNVAELYFESEQMEQALIYATQGIEIGAQVGHQKALAGSLHTLAKILFYQGDVEGSINYHKQSIAIAKKMDYRKLIDESLDIQTLIYAAQGRNAEAIKSYLTNDLKRLEQVNETLNEQLARFESTQLSQQIENLQQSKKLQQLEDIKEKQQRNFIIVGIIFTLVVLFLGYRRYSEIQLTKDLEKGVKQRTEALEYLTQELKQANKVKSQFLANMSHEIRTPLTAVIGQSEAIIHGDFDNETLAKEVEIIHNNSLHLLHLINDILDISKIEADKFELENRPQDLHIIINELEDMFTKQATRKNLAFTVTHQLPQPFIINIDGFRLKQVLINLCSNAIKFTTEGWVTLDISIVDRELFFTVTDTGIGMEEKQLSKIFNSFTQADNSISRRFSGSGLGLFLSMQLTKVMSGDLSVNSQVGQGSTFVLKLPFGDVSNKEFTKEQSLIDTPPKRYVGKVLLADDHDDNRRLIARLLASLGLEVVEASNGKEAVEQCMQHQPTLTLLDIQMPEMDGIEALKKIREFGCTQAVYALTANAMSHEIQQYLSLGFTGHLKKPIEREKFIATIAHHYEKIEQSVIQMSEDMADVDISDLKVKFQQHLIEDAERIMEFCQSQDYEQLAKVTHKLSGAAQMFGFSELSQSAQEVELAIKNQNITVVDELCHCLLDELKIAQEPH